ncbi:hypothetical protein AWQ21_14985 (plasmid) [Picosynechococcus sp. PCC 7003]|nr:hypothetical protein AWQ21_14985 [Picosynechococcus sp. PCC 7003]
MFLVDTSVWINLFRDRTSSMRQKFEIAVAEQPYYLSRFTQVALLQGSRNEQEWQLLNSYRLYQRQMKS